MKYKKKLPHDKHLTDLYGLVKSKYTAILLNVDYPFSDGHQDGEVDLIGIKADGFDLYEVKSHYTPDAEVKAIKQLERAREYFGFQGNSYLYTPERKILNLERIVSRKEGQMELDLE